jgi:hypothetical protein
MKDMDTPHISIVLWAGLVAAAAVAGGRRDDKTRGLTHNGTFGSSWPNIQPLYNHHKIMLIIISFSILPKAKYPKYYKQNAYAMAHEVSFVCFGLFCSKKVNFNANLIENFLNLC